MGYQVSTIRTLVREYSAVIKVISWDDNKDIPYKIPEVGNVTFYKKSAFNYTNIKNVVNEFKPDIIGVSGWIVKDYNKICRYAKKKGIITIAASDTQWMGTLRQKIASFIARYYHHKKFDYLWVAGPRQFEYARRLKYKNNKILYNSLSADIDLFKKEFDLNFRCKNQEYPRTILFAGRFSKEKGLESLLEIFNELNKQNFKWKLILVGDGPLKSEIYKNKNVEVLNYMQPEELPAIIRKSGFVILPSISEPWGLVIHEFAAAGLPIICSEQCGASTEFVINGYNGFTFDSKNRNSLKDILASLSHISDEELITMGKNSHRLSQRITPESAAANFMSVI